MTQMPRPRRRLTCALAVACTLLLSGCTPDAGSAPTKSASKGDGRDKGHLVEVATVARDTLHLSRVYTGSLRARRVVRVHVQEEGRLTSLPYFEGDRVQAGEALLSLDSTLLETEIEKALAVRREAEANLARLQRLEKSRMVAEDEVLRARTAVDVAKVEETLLRTRLGYTVVSAPFAGQVTARLVDPGDILERHQHVLTLADPNSLVADLEVSELVLPHLAVGHLASVRIDALGGQAFPGRVQRIHPAMDPSTRQGRVEVELDPAPAGARAGQFARVSFEISALDRQVIPFSALRRDTEGEYVFRLAGDATVERVRVRGGRRLAERVEVLEGLADGDRIVTRGFLGLSAGATVKIVGAGAKKKKPDAEKAAAGAGEKT